MAGMKEASKMKMTPEQYFNKYHCVYGISIGEHNGHARIFTDISAAREWEKDRPAGYDVIARYLCSKGETEGFHIIK